jgi:putative hemolysin
MKVKPNSKNTARIEPSVIRALAALGVVFALIGFAFAQAPKSGGPVDGIDVNSAIGWPVFILILLVIIVVNGAAVAAEAATDLLRPIHVKHLREKSEKEALRLQTLLDGRVGFVAACRLSSDLARLVIFLLVLAVSPGITRRFGYEPTYPNVLAAAFLTMIPVGLFNLVFELVPRSYAVLHPHGTAGRLYAFIRAASLVLSVPAAMATGLANVIAGRFGGKASFAIANQAEEEIKTIVASAEESGEIEVDEREMLHSVFEFSDTIAREVMTPRVDIDALPVGCTHEQVMDLIQGSGHSRIPLYEQTDDQIVGIIHAKDLFMAMLSDQERPVRTLMRPATFVPENKNLHELLAEMRAQRSQLVVVQDEFGGTAGIVTIEDIVEELVGDIVDEYDVEEPGIIPVEGGWMADGKTRIDELNEQIGAEFDSEEFDTVGGYVFGLFGRQPKLGEEIGSDNGFLFKVAETDGRRILKLQIRQVFIEPDASEREESNSF